ncbi:hypothetical protein [Actinoplanes aureus]|uniref:DUF4034 domain-containing protein n=1 Tax=Actinoplanes aureus TaxID=2792083 RepID=A0A931G1E8_9ACTN|nr:hypothetical protein [Actinoplanes aureus]MBG0562274.1 hypothetical protein [Actinoplanes aureus]
MFFYARVFLRHFYGSPLPEAPEFDDDKAPMEPFVRDAVERVRAGDWWAGRKLIEDAGTDWDVRDWRISALASMAAEDDRWLYAWLRAEPSDPAAVLIQAMLLHQQAADARGSASAAHTSAEQFQNFRALSDAAAQVGRRAMALAGPYDPVPWSTMLSTMFADRNAVEQSFDEVFNEGRRRDPYNFDLHLTATTLRCQKWYGSHEQMFAIARGVAAAAPPGHKSTLLPLFAHFEYAMREFSWDERTKRSRRRCEKYFRRPEVGQELDQWIAKFRAGSPGAGPLSLCRQWMAVYYSLAGRRKDAKVVFDELGQFPDPSHEWNYFWGDREWGYLQNWWWANGVRP